ncbi:MAG TPA: hypothetical protein DCY13_16960, partial [Verrucomicrobiales bacterium]|nr:hypothetical protein [Verrucomicrobiales bacterium]
HVLFSFYVAALCRRTGTKAGIGAWLPLFNLVTLMRAAKMSGAWPLLGIIGYLAVGVSFGNQMVHPASVAGLIVVGLASVLILITGVMWFVWCFKICIARQRSGWLGLLLLIPGVNLVMFTYLAFAD